MKFHHIGVVVPNIQKSLEEIIQFLNFENVGIPMLVDSQKVNVCFLKMGKSYLELIEPATENSPVSNFAKVGGGFHHICFEVEDINKEIEKLVNKGGRIIVKPIKGFENRLIAFVMLNMKNTKCNLIELAEKRK